MLTKRQAHQDLISAADIMSEKPAAAGAAGISASVAEVGVGGTADQLDNVRVIFTTLGMTITHCDGMINTHNLTGMDDFYYIRVDDSGSFIKVWNYASQVVAKKLACPNSVICRVYSTGTMTIKRGG